ncbi:MAG: hypothetical protein M1823_002040 [Watsoniomyces obsoletus]|nr:MAG: hypothetical protein M1823_002040 [Watsoniomyces obsoletus]
MPGAWIATPANNSHRSPTPTPSLPVVPSFSPISVPPPTGTSFGMWALQAALARETAPAVAAPAATAAANSSFGGIKLSPTIDREVEMVDAPPPVDDGLAEVHEILARDAADKRRRQIQERAWQGAQEATRMQLAHSLALAVLTAHQRPGSESPSGELTASALMSLEATMRRRVHLYARRLPEAASVSSRRVRDLVFLPFVHSPARGVSAANLAEEIFGLLYGRRASRLSALDRHRAQGPSRPGSRRRRVRPAAVPRWQSSDSNGEEDHDGMDVEASASRSAPSLPPSSQIPEPPAISPRVSRSQPASFDLVTGLVFDQDGDISMDVVAWWDDDL